MAWEGVRGPDLNTSVRSPPKSGPGDGAWRHGVKLAPIDVAILVKHVSAGREGAFQVRAEMVEVETAGDVAVVVLGVLIPRLSVAAADGDAGDQYAFGGGY